MIATLPATPPALVRPLDGVSTIALHGESIAGVRLGVDSAGVPFYWGLYGTAPDLFGSATTDGLNPAANRIVVIDYRDAAPASARWHQVAQATTDGQGEFYVSTTHGAFHRLPQHSGVFRARLLEPSGGPGATSPYVGFFVVPRISISSAPVQHERTYRLAGRVVAAAPAGTLRLLDARDRTIERRSLDGRGAFSFSLRADESGTYRYRLSFTPRNPDDAEPAERAVSVTIALPVARAPAAPTRVVVHPEQTRPARNYVLPNVGF
jgi:hypothetical protein